MTKDIKDTIILITACVTLASGITMSFLSFFLSEIHEISSTVLWYFAQCLMYTASALGIYGYVHSKTLQITKEIANHVK